MDLFTYALLGIIQGLTEFLPVSSSGHLVLAEHWLKLNPPGVILEVALHVATLISVVIVYRRDILEILIRRDKRYLGLIIIGTTITVLIVWPLRSYLSDLTEAPYAVRLVGAMLLVTAAWLTFADWRLRQTREHLGVGKRGAAWTGFAQALAALPGISRSGATIGALIQLGARREEAARFSFLLSIPIILGAALITAVDAIEANATADGATTPLTAIDPLGLAIAFVLSLVFGVLAIHLVLGLLKHARLSYFALYCTALGLAALIIG